MNNTGVIWMLHGIEPDSPRTQASDLYRNLMLPPEKLEALITEARDRKYEFVSMARFLADQADGQEHRDVLITIDDGLRNIYTHGFPIFRRLHVPFAFFVATDLIENGFAHCRNAEMDGMAILCDHIATHGGDFTKMFRHFRHLKRMLPFVNGRRLLAGMLGNNIDFARYQCETICSPNELREMSDSGLCEVGSHTARHVHLDRTHHLVRELSSSKAKIEQWTGKSCDYFSYPYGHVNDHARMAVQEFFKGATCDVTGELPVVTSADDPCLLKRTICLRSSKIEDLLPND